MLVLSSAMFMLVHKVCGCTRGRIASDQARNNLTCDYTVTGLTEGWTILSLNVSTLGLLNCFVITVAEHTWFLSTCGQDLIFLDLLIWLISSWTKRGPICWGRILVWSILHESWSMKLLYLLLITVHQVFSFWISEMHCLCTLLPGAV